MRTDINIKNRWIVLMRRNAFVKAFQPQTKELSQEEENEKQILQISILIISQINSTFFFR